MNLSQLIKQTNRDVDDSYSNADLTDWMNRALDDLTPLVKKESKQSYTIDSTNSYSIPTDFYETVHIIVDSNALDQVPMKDFDSIGYKVFADQLSLQNGPESGTIDLYYHRKLSKLVNADDVPEIEEPYHDLLILYAIAHSQYMDDEPQRQADAFNRYNVRKNEYEQYKANKNQYPSTIEVVYGY